MITIRKKHFDAFYAIELNRFKEDMNNHIKNFFPYHWAAMGNVAVSDTVNYAILRCENHCITTKRNICLYLNAMIVWGSNFDNDYQYPWAKEILGEKEKKDETTMINTLTEKSYEFYKMLVGPEQVFIKNSINYLLNNYKNIFNNFNLNSKFACLSEIFPHKYSLIGEQNLTSMMNSGKNRCKQYGFSLEGDYIVYYLLMFCLGSGFDRDPQYPWAEQLLKDRLINKQLKIHDLYNNLLATLRYLVEYP